MVTETEGRQAIAGRVELGAHAPLLGKVYGRGELVAAHVPGLCAWRRRPRERPEHFEARVVSDMTALGLAA